MFYQLSDRPLVQTKEHRKSNNHTFCKLGRDFMALRFEECNAGFLENITVVEGKNHTLGNSCPGARHLGEMLWTSNIGVLLVRSINEASVLSCAWSLRSV